MNDFIAQSLSKLKEKNIPNAEIDLRVLLNYSKFSKNDIILSNFDLNQINIKLFKKLFLIYIIKYKWKLIKKQKLN